MNLCNHVSEFGFDAIWSFFAISHGKSPCHNIVGSEQEDSIKKFAKICLTNQILTLKLVKEFCNKNIVEITFFCLYNQGLI